MPVRALRQIAMPDFVGAFGQIKARDFAAAGRDRTDKARCVRRVRRRRRNWCPGRPRWRQGDRDCRDRVGPAMTPLTSRRAAGRSWTKAAASVQAIAVSVRGDESGSTRPSLPTLIRRSTRIAVEISRQPPPRNADPIIAPRNGRHIGDDEDWRHWARPEPQKREDGIGPVIADRPHEAARLAIAAMQGRLAA